MKIAEHSPHLESLQELVDSLPAFIFTNRPDGYLDYCNRSMLEYLGVTFEALEGAKWGAVVHPEDVGQVTARLQVTLASGEPFACEARVRRADGEFRWMLHRVVAARDESGRIVRLFGSSVDIDDRKRAEFYLAEGERLAHMGSWVFAPTGVFEHWSRELFHIYGLDQASGAPSLQEYLACIHPQDREFMASLIERMVAEASGCDVIKRIVRPDGDVRHVRCVGTPVVERGTLQRIVGTAMDVTEHELLTQELRRAEEKLQQENVALREEIDKASMFEEIVGASAALKAVITRVSKVAASDSTVLINGETGTGKELVARAIHRRSPRSSRAFVAVNCAAIPRDLIASELFGHEKGAFTGATQRRLGRFELADGGTIFLDEVGEVSPDTQVALLRVLQEREFERVGGRQPIRVDVRVIAATNRDLNAAVADGTFRQDLFYRLNVFPLEMPSLRDRRDDIPVLVEYFIDRYARKAGKTIRRVNTRTLDRLQSYPWPGNVRELQNVIERSVIVCDTDEFTVDESWLSTAPAVENARALSSALAGHEKSMIEDALRASGGRVFGPSGAAARLGIARSTLESKIRALGVNKNRFRGRSAKQ